MALPALCLAAFICSLAEERWAFCFLFLFFFPTRIWEGQAILLFAAVGTFLLGLSAFHPFRPLRVHYSKY